MSNQKKTPIIFRPPDPRPQHEIIKNWQGNSEHPCVSIVCHTYQHGKYIKDALNSFLMQETNFPFEIIVRDDASTDGTRQIVEEYARLYPLIIKPILPETNEYSKGIKPSTITFPLAKGDYIAMCEGDDYWCDNEKLKKQIDFLQSNPEYVITYHDATVIDDQDNVKTPSQLGKNKLNYTQIELQTGALMPTLTRCFRNVIKEFPPEFFNVVAGDVFITSLLGNYGKAKYLNEIEPSIYRQHSGGIWAGVDERKKRFVMATSFYWLSVYYERNNIYDIADKNSLSAIIAISQGLPISRTSVTKYAISMFFGKWYTSYHKLKRSLKTYIRFK